MSTNIRELLTRVTAMTPVVLNTNTDPRLRGGKKNPHIGHVRKVNEGIEVIIFQNKKASGYERMVKLGLSLEDKDPSSFQLSERTWGTRVKGTCFVEHKGEFYLEVIVDKHGKVSYELDGKMISKQNVRGIPPTPNGGSQGGLEKKVVINTLKISSLTSIVVDGTEYTDLYYPS